MRRLPRSTPEAQGIPSSVISDFVRAVDANLHDLHSVMLMRHGNVVAEGWWAPYGSDHPHMLFSISKSFVSTAIGMAVAEGLLNLDDAVVSLLPDDAPDEISDNLAAMRVRHLLTMSTGHATDTLSAIDQNREGNWARAVLAEPVEHVPGTTFVYNSGATYVLSAIMQRLTGQRVIDYLTPRLFVPLGINGATWETCPRGIDTGGWGLSITTEDIAKFGQLYLQKGEWNGRQLVPSRWVDIATSSQIANADAADNADGRQGYGFQFWRSQHGAYRADGAFAQLCIVMPEQDAVLVITGGLTDAQLAMDAVWTHLLPKLSSTVPLPEDETASLALAGALTRLELPHPAGERTSDTAARVSGLRYAFPENFVQLDQLAVNFATDGAVFTIWHATGQHTVECGYRAWLPGSLPFLADTRVGAEERAIAASGAWSDENTYVARLHFYETPFSLTVTLTYRNHRVTMHLAQNVSFDPTELPTIVGHTEPQ